MHQGVFAVTLPDEKVPDYRIAASYAGSQDEETLLYDPYRYLPTLGEFDLYLFGEGTQLRAQDKLGAHRMQIAGVAGVHFAVWAPNAAARQRDRRLQRLGRPGPPDAPARVIGRVGDLRPRRARRREVQVRDPREDRRILKKSDP